MAGAFDQVRDALFGRDGRSWAGSVEDLLFDGETIRRRVTVGDNRVVVTSHRLLAFTPDGDGENYQQVDLPNVTDVRAGHRGESNLLGRAARAFVYGGVLLAVGLAVDFESVVPTDAFSGTGGAAARTGLGGILGTMETFLGLIAQLDELARTVGALLVLFGVFVVGVYYLTRERALEVAVAGEAEDVLVPAADADVDAAAADLEAVVFGADGGDRQAGDAGLKSDDPLEGGDGPRRRP